MSPEEEAAFALIISWIEELNDQPEYNLWTANEVVAYLQGRRRGEH